MNGSLHKSLKATQDANLDVKDRPVVKDSINLDTGEFMDFLAASSHDFYEALRSTGVKRKGSADAYDVSLPNSPRFGDDGAIAKTTSLDILTNVSSLKYDEVRESPQRILSNRQFQNQRMTEFEEPVLSPPRFNTKNVANQKLGYGSIQGLPSFDFHDSFFTTAVNTNFHGIAPADKQQKRDSFASYAGSEGDSDKNFRGKYKCGRCGQPKVNHNCEFVAEADVISTGTQCSFDSPQPHEKFLTVIRRKSIFEALPRSNGEDISRSISSGYVGLGYGVTPLFLGQNSKAMQDFQSNHIDKLSEVDEKRQEEFRISSNKEIPKSPLSVSNSDKIGKKNSQKSNMDPKNEKFSEEEEIIINILASSSTDYYDDNGGSASREFK